jgi:inorganic pyrophosphatase
MSDNFVDMIVEIPYNSLIKYEFDEKYKIMRCDRILNTSMLYPGNYGFIPNTLSGDNDPLDILLLTEYPIFPGTIINVKIIGVLLTTDEMGDDEKLLAVPSNKVDPKFTNINDLTDLDTSTLNKIKHFFTHYKDNDANKWVKVKNFENKDFALKILENSKLNFKANL